MSLNYDLKNVADFKTKCFYKGRTDGRLQPVTQALVFATMAVDLGAITEKNVNEWRWRLEFLRSIGHGDWVYENDKSRSFTSDEVRAHIGLRTNVCDTKRPAFMKRWMRELERDVDGRLSYEDIVANKKANAA